MADHDQRFKTLLQTRFADLLRLILGDEDAARYDCERVEWLSQEIFADPPVGQRQAVDLVARLPVREAVDADQASEPEPWLLLVHVEVESADTVAPLHKRIYDYRHELRRKHNLPVLSLGVYLSVALGGLGWATYLEVYHGHEIVRFRYPYVGLPGLDAEPFLTGDNLLATALVGLMHIPEGRQAEFKAEAMQRLADSGLSQIEKFLLIECLEAYLPLVDPHLSEYWAFLQTNKKYEGAMKIGKTSREEGIEQGREEGGKLALQSLVLEMLEEQFGPLTPALRERVAGLTEEQLRPVAKRAMKAASLRELGLEDEPATGA